MGFIMTAGRSSAIRRFCQAHGIRERKQVHLAFAFDLKAHGQLYHYDDDISLDAPLAEVVCLARLVRASTRCKAVEFAWPGGAGVVVGRHTLIMSMPSAGYDEMARRSVRDEYLAEGCTEEEADAMAADDDRVQEREVEYRDWLQQTWQAMAIQARGYPDRAALAAQAPFSTLFELGFDIAHRTGAQMAELEQAIAAMRGKGPSYTDLDKACAFLAGTAEDPGHDQRIELFFERAPKRFLDRVGNFTALIPLCGGDIVRHGSARVRGSVRVGRLAAGRAPGFDSGYRHLLEPAKSDRAVLCAALAGKPANLQHAPADVQRDVAALQRMLSEADSPQTDGKSGRRLARRIDAIERLDEAIAWSIGRLGSKYSEGSVSALQMVALHERLHGLAG